MPAPVDDDELGYITGADDELGYLTGNSPEVMPVPVAANPSDFGAVSDDGGGASDFVPANPSDFGGVDDFGDSDMDSAIGQMDGYAKGGMIRGLLGPNPKGPDDGFAMVQRGEYVIRKSAVKKYGRGLLDMINEGKVPAKKIKSLLD
jgi:hypothetical protein